MSNNSKKQYVVKVVGSMLYLKNVDRNNIEYTLDIEKAQKVNKNEVEELCKIDTIELVNYKEELYRYKDKNYRTYIKAISKEKCEIKKEDLINFLEEYQFAPDGSGQFTAYLELEKNYHNSKMLNEIIRIGKIILYADDIELYEGLKKLAKDKKFNDGRNNRVNLTEENRKEYEKNKILLKELKQPFDYDIRRQYEILEKSFNDKYITKEIFKEYLELYEEDYEEYEEEFETET